MANVNVPNNPSQQKGTQAGHDPHQGNKREVGSEQMPNRRADKDHEEPSGKTKD